MNHRGGSFYGNSGSVESSGSTRTPPTFCLNPRTAAPLAILFLVVLACSGTLSQRADAQSNEWTWMGGTTQNVTTWQTNPNIGVTGAYGTLNVPSMQNIPGPRQHSATWKDSSGNLWLFGGSGIDVNGSSGYLNDLWKFNPATQEWTWMGGAQSVGSVSLCSNEGCGQSGVYGTLGTSAAGNVPGGREGPASWTDANGNFWMFGGQGYDSNGTFVYLNDLWQYNPTTNQWTWMGGPSSV